MKKYRVVTTESANDDLINIYNFLAFERQEGQVAVKVLKAITEEIYSLNIVPLRAEVLYVDENIRAEYRSISVKGFRIIYTVEGNTVVVVRVAHHSREIQNLFV